MYIFSANQELQTWGVKLFNESKLQTKYNWQSEPLVTGRNKFRGWTNYNKKTVPDYMAFSKAKKLEVFINFIIIFFSTKIICTYQLTAKKNDTFHMY